MTLKLDKSFDWVARFIREIPAAVALFDRDQRYVADRRQFAGFLHKSLADPEPERRSVTVFAVDLDGFRNLNTLHGCAIGDQVLKIIGERLVAGTRSRRPGEAAAAGRGTDLVARL